jgi:hypothetical protein
MVQQQGNHDCTTNTTTGSTAAASSSPSTMTVSHISQLSSSHCRHASVASSTLSTTANTTTTTKMTTITSAATTLRYRLLLILLLVMIVLGTVYTTNERTLHFFSVTTRTKSHSVLSSSSSSVDDDEEEEDDATLTTTTIRNSNPSTQNQQDNHNTNSTTVTSTAFINHTMTTDNNDDNNYLNNRDDDMDTNESFHTLNMTTTPTTTTAANRNLNSTQIASTRIITSNRTCPYQNTWQDWYDQNRKRSSSNSNSDNYDSTTNINAPRGIVWLTSFPNSGTTYTLSIVQSMTQTSTATNYGGNERDTKCNSIPVLPHTNTRTNEYGNASFYHENGPYYRNPERVWYPSRNIDETQQLQTAEIFQYRTAHILTKTHCEQHVTGTLTQFMTSCATGTRYYNYSSITTTYSYASPYLTGIVYLIRNPYDNIVARMNYQRNQWLYHSHNDSVNIQRANFFPPHNRTGFYWWCQYKDIKQRSIRDTVLQFEQQQHYNLSTLLQRVPCAMEFYLYFRWHNKMNDMISYYNDDGDDDDQRNEYDGDDQSTEDNTISKATNKIPKDILILRYEDYEPTTTTTTTSTNTNRMNNDDRIRTTMVEPLLYDMLHFTPNQIVNTTVPLFLSHSSSSNATTTSSNTSRANNPTTSLSLSSSIAIYYKPTEQRAIYELAKAVCTPKTWSRIQHYFAFLEI